MGHWSLEPRGLELQYKPPGAGQPGAWGRRVEALGATQAFPAKKTQIQRYGHSGVVLTTFLCKFRVGAPPALSLTSVAVYWATQTAEPS